MVSWAARWFWLAWLLDTCACYNKLFVSRVLIHFVSLSIFRHLNLSMVKDLYWKLCYHLLHNCCVPLNDDQRASELKEPKGIRWKSSLGTRYDANVILIQTYVCNRKPNTNFCSHQIEPREDSAQYCFVFCTPCHYKNVFSLSKNIQNLHPPSPPFLWYRAWLTVASFDQFHTEYLATCLISWLGLFQRTRKQVLPMVYTAHCAYRDEIV